MKELRFSFLDVGMGDGTMITCPDGELILVDLGSKKNANIAGADAIKSVTRMIKDSREKRALDSPTLDHLILTHGDGDHYNLLEPLLQAIESTLGGALEIKLVTIGGPVTEYSKKVRRSVLTSAENDGRLAVLKDSDHDHMGKDGKVTPRWTIAPGVKIYLLSANYPTRNKKGVRAKNAKSIVLMFEYGDPASKVILTGDAEDLTEAAIMGYYAGNLGFLEAYALKLGHHGSVAGSSKPWLKAVKQSASFASSDMKWAHPYCETISRIVNAIGSGDKLVVHKWLCGKGSRSTKEYINHENKDGFYTTMAYITEDKYYDKEEDKWYAPGLVQGVQYDLVIRQNGKIDLYSTLDDGSDAFAPETWTPQPYAAASLPPQPDQAPQVPGD